MPRSTLLCAGMGWTRPTRRLARQLWCALTRSAPCRGADPAETPAAFFLTPKAWHADNSALTLNVESVEGMRAPRVRCLPATPRTRGQRGP